MAWPVTMRQRRTADPRLVCGTPRPHSTRSPTCRWPAGNGTGHPGYGACWRCGGRQRRQEEAWRVAGQIAQELDVSPWDALLAAVKISAFKVADYERRLEVLRRQHGADVDREGQLGRGLLLDSERERKHLARVAKAAVDAGVAERIVRQVELEGAVVVRALGVALDGLSVLARERGVPEELVADLRVRAHEDAHRELLALPNPEDLLEAG